MRNITEKHRRMEEMKENRSVRVVKRTQDNTEKKPNATLQKKKPTKARPGPISADSDGVYMDPEKPFRVISTPTEMVDARFRGEMRIHPKSHIANLDVVKTLTKGLLAPHNVLGQVLYRAAILSEAMEYYHEEKLLETFLHNNPPFHPRRTLDQSYYWTLKTTKRRDRDQVVYRATAPDKKFMHDANDEEKGCTRYGCKQCRRDIRKLPRVIMVDQLWLWILDGSKKPFSHEQLPALTR